MIGPSAFEPVTSDRTPGTGHGGCGAALEFSTMTPTRKRPCRREDDPHAARRGAAAGVGVKRRRFRKWWSDRARSIRPRTPRDRNAGRTRPPRTEQAPRLFGPAGLKVGFQQREVDQVMLRAATADALVFGGERGKHFYRREKISTLERRDAT
jgi:hypothetical protein